MVVDLAKKSLILFNKVINIYIYVTKSLWLWLIDKYHTVLFYKSFTILMHVVPIKMESLGDNGHFVIIVDDTS